MTARPANPGGPARPGEQAVIEVRGVTKRFGPVSALHDVTLDVYRGEFLTLLGPSGCCKTTLLRIIAGFETPTSGRVWIAGRDLTSAPPERRPLNMVFQRYALFPHLTVHENMAFGLQLKRAPAPEIAQRVQEALALVRLEGLGDRMPHQLSGGQSQRVALARALVNQPEVLLLDEPLSALDRKIRQQMQEELRAIQAQVGTTFLYVTHDQEEAMAMSTRIALMSHGHIEQLALPEELYRRPSSSFAADFVGDANLLEGRAVASPAGLTLEWCGITLPGVQLKGLREGERVRFMVRPEAIHVAVAPGSGTIRATVGRSSFYGFYWMHRMKVNGDGPELLVREVGEAATAKPGMTVWLTIDPERAIAVADGRGSSSH